MVLGAHVVNLISSIFPDTGAMTGTTGARKGLA